VGNDLKGDVQLYLRDRKPDHKHYGTVRNSGTFERAIACGMCICRFTDINDLSDAWFLNPTVETEIRKLLTAYTLNNKA
jgi:hypothetical protein